MSILKDISLDALKRAAEIRQQIDDLEKELDSLLTGKAAPRKKAKSKAAKKKKKSGKRKLSPEALDRIRAAQKRRWAKVKKDSEKSKAPAAKKKATGKRKSAK